MPLEDVHGDSDSYLDITNDSPALQNVISEFSDVICDNILLPDVIPKVQGRKRETIREELFRRSTQLRGKLKSRIPQIDMNRISLPTSRFSLPKRLGRELSADTNIINLNDDPI